MKNVVFAIVAAVVTCAAAEREPDFQKLIDDAALAGGGVVTVPAGRHVTKGLILKSNVELHLEKGATLEGSTNAADYARAVLPYSEGDWMAVVMAVGAENVAVTGEGEVFGNGTAWPLPDGYGGNQEGSRPRGLAFLGCRSVRLEDFTLRDAACWGIVFKCCDGVVARRVKVSSQANINNDGFDIEARNVVIEDCDVESGDDSFCIKSNDPGFAVENVAIRRCVGRTFCYPFKLGTASHGAMRNVLFEDCRSELPKRWFMDTRWGRNRKMYAHADRTAKNFLLTDKENGVGHASISVQCVDGGIFENIVFRNIEVEGTAVPIFIRGGTRTGRDCGTPANDKHVIRDILVENVSGRWSSAMASSISGVEGCRVKNVTLRNVHLHGPGAGDCEAEKTRPVPENAGNYPEANMFKCMLPAYGLWARHVDGLVLDDVSFTLDEGTTDARDCIVTDDVTRVSAVPDDSSVASPGPQFDGVALAKEELKHHLALVADNAPYDFLFEKPADAPEPEPFGSRYRVEGKTVWFWGDDSGPDEVWDWGDDRGRESQKRNGTLFAVELFAERELGLRFVWPGADGIVAPSRVAVLKLPERAEGRFASALMKGRIRNYEAYHPTPWEMVSNAMPRALFDAPPPSTFESRWLWQKRMMMQDREFFNYGHAFKDWKQRFGETHPEYLNLRAATGERGAIGRKEGPDRTKFCVSNDAVVDQIVADWLAAGTNRFLNVCENDSFNWCECEKCCALDVPLAGEERFAHVTDRYVNFWNRIAAKARAVRPDVMLITYIYSSYRHPPRRERIEFPDNMLFGFISTEIDDCFAMIDAWRAAGMKTFFFRPNYLHTTVTLHRGLERFFCRQFKELVRRGMIGCDFDADSHRPTTAFEQYVLARLIADPDTPFETIAVDWFSAYGAAADEVRAYYEAVWETGEKARAAAQAANVSTPEMFEDRTGKLPKTQEFGRSEDEIAAKKVMLDAAVARHLAAGDLSPIESRRLSQLALEAEHGLLTYRFLIAVADGPLDAMKARADELVSFRIRNREALPDVWSHLYRHTWAEARYWRRYLKRCRDGK